MEFFKVSDFMPPCISMLNQIEGTAFRDIKEVKVYPSVGMKRPHAQLSVNFGQKPFMFDIDRMVSVRYTFALIVRERCLQVKARKTNHNGRNQRR